jgi:hypothetical protein
VQQLGVAAWFAVDVQAEAVEEVMIDDRQVTLAQLVACGLKPGRLGQGC